MNPEGVLQAANSATPLAVAVMALGLSGLTVFYGSKIVTLLGNHLMHKMDDLHETLRDIKQLLEDQ